MPALDAVYPDPITDKSGAFVFLEAWRFIDAWRPTGGMGVGRARLRDLEVFMAEAKMTPEEKHFCRQVVSDMDSAYVGEMASLASGKVGTSQSEIKSKADQWARLKHSRSSSS